MKIKSLLTITAISAALAPAMAQAPSHLKVSPAAVHPGQTLTLTYDANGTKLEKSTSLTATAWLFGPKGIPAAVDVNFKKSGAAWTAQLPLADSVSMAAFRFSDGALVDDSSPKGYLVDVTDAAGKPVKGTMWAHALVSSSMASLMGVKADNAEASASLNQEIAAFPANAAGTKNTFMSLAIASKDPARIAAAKVEMAKMFNDPTTPENMLTSAAAQLSAGNKAKVDSFAAIIKQRYPKGLRAAADIYQEFSKEKDPALKAGILAKIKGFDTNPYENAMINAMANLYAQAGDAENFRKYAGMIKDKASLASLYNSVAWPLAEKGDKLDFAAPLSKASLELLDADLTNPTGMAVTYYPLSQRQKNNRSMYGMFADTYGLILYKQGKVAEALAYQEKAVKLGSPSPEVNERYALFLTKNGKVAEAKKALEGYISSGKSTPAMKENLKEIYTKEKGSDANFTAYVASLESAAKAKAREELATKMINTKAPTFALKDFDGKEVSLESLKGKVVVVDFWATWCGPCKASFPGMQLALNKYKDDQNVKFVFIDTWETDPNYMDLAKKFIAENKYTFHVLYDMENKASKRHGKIVEDYGVDGIPTKFVIDKSGNIRFKSVGYMGSTEGLADEISSMIEMASNPPVLAETGKD